MKEEREWPDELDALAAALWHHTLLTENVGAQELYVIRVEVKNDAD